MPRRLLAPGEGQEAFQKQLGIVFLGQGGQLRPGRSSQASLQDGAMGRRDPAQGRSEIRGFGKGPLQGTLRSRRGEYRPVEDLRE